MSDDKKKNDDDAKTPAKAKLTAKPIKVITADPQARCARFTPCGRFLVAASFDARVRRWDWEGEEPTELPSMGGHGGWVDGLAFHPTEDLVFSADSWGKLQAWRHGDKEPEPVWQKEDAHDGWIRQLDVSPDGALLASCGMDRKIRLWNTADGKPVRELSIDGPDLFTVRFHPGGKELISGDLKGVAQKWNVESGKAAGQFDASALFLRHRLQDVGGVRALAFDAEGKTLACGGTRPKNGGSVQGVPTVLLFDYESGKQIHELTFGSTQHCYVHDIILHKDGFVMAVTSGTPGSGQLLFQTPGEEKAFFQHTKIPNLHSLSLHPDGRRLAVAGTNRGSNGNGRRLNKDGEYEGNKSPIHLFELTSS